MSRKCIANLGLSGFEILVLDLAFSVLFSHWKQKSYVKFPVQCNFYLPYIWNSFQCFELLPLVFHPGRYCVLRNIILNSNFLIQDAFLDISQSIALMQRKFFPIKHCVKYARIRIFSPGIFLYKDRIVDSVVTRENTSKGKPVFSHNLRNEIGKKFQIKFLFLGDWFHIPSKSFLTHVKMIIASTNAQMCCAWEFVLMWLRRSIKSTQARTQVAF